MLYICKECKAANFKTNAKLDGKINDIPDQIKKMDNTINNIQNMLSSIVDPKLKSMEASYASVVKGLESNSTLITNATQKVTKLSEKDSKETRDKNLILFGIEESQNKNDTVEKVKNLFSECHMSYKLDPNKIFRLGRINDENSQGGQKVRPLKICTTSKEEKWEIVKRVNNLRKSKVFAKLDMTKEERDEDFRLFQTLKKTRDKNPSDKFKIFRKQIVKINS